MDFNDTPKQAEFRAKCRDWLDANAVSYTHLRAPRDRTRYRMPSSA